MVTRIASTIRYSPIGSVRRRSQAQETMKESPTNTRTPPTTIRGIRPTTDAPNTTPARGRRQATSPAERASTDICSASDGQAQRVVPGDAAERARDHVRHPRVTQLPVRIQVPIQQQLDAADVEEARHQGHEDGRRDARGLVEHGRPVRRPCFERPERRRLPQPVRDERAQQPSTASHGEQGVTGEQHHDHEHHDGDRQDGRDHERASHEPRRHEQHHAEGERRTPTDQHEGVEGLAQRAEVHPGPTGDLQTAAEQQPSGAGKEPPDHGIGDEPCEVAQAE